MDAVEMAHKNWRNTGKGEETTRMEPGATELKNTSYNRQILRTGHA